MSNFPIFKFKVSFYKIENLAFATFYLENNFLICSETLRVVRLNKKRKKTKYVNLYFLISCSGNCKHAIFFVIMPTLTQGRKSLFFYTESE